MSTIIIVDTTIFMNVLDVPGFNQNRDIILKELRAIISNQRITMLLPLVAIIESGNHIAQLADGRHRRQFGESFADQVRQAINGNSPWTPTQALETEVVASWMGAFPDYAMRGLGLADLSILKEFDAACIRHPRLHIKIWSLDGHLAGYDRAHT